MQNNGSTQSTTTPGVPANLFAILQAYALPMPAGTNENGEPFWVINNQKVAWAQMHQLIWMKQNAARQNASGGNVEKAPIMPNMPTQMESGLEAKLETKPESAIEKPSEKITEKIDNAAESNNQPNTSPNQSQSTTPKKSQVSYLGDSPKLKSVDLGDPDSMMQFVQDNSDTPATSSRHFLSVMLNRVLAILSLDKN